MTGRRRRTLSNAVLATVLVLLMGGVYVASAYGSSLAAMLGDAGTLLSEYAGGADDASPADTDSDTPGTDSGTSDTSERPSPVQSSPLLDAIRGPLRPPGEPPDLSGESGARDEAAAAATRSIQSVLGGAEVVLEPLWHPSPEGSALTASLTAGAASEGTLRAATNQVVVRIDSALSHAADVLGAAVVAEAVTRLRAEPLGAPRPGSLVRPEIDGLFDGYWLALGGEPAVTAVLTVNADTFGTYGVDDEGRLRPVVDLTYPANGSFRVPIASGGIEATLWHEFGHAVFSLAQRLNTLDKGHWTQGTAAVEAHLRAAVGTADWDRRGALVSGYATANVSELVAECFAEYLGNHDPRPFSRTVVAETLSAIRGATPRSAGPFLR